MSQVSTRMQRSFQHDSCNTCLSFFEALEDPQPVRVTICKHHNSERHSFSVVDSKQELGTARSHRRPGLLPRTLIRLHQTGGHDAAVMYALRVFAGL